MKNEAKPTSGEVESAAAGSAPASKKKWLMTLLKVAVAVGSYLLIFKKVLGREGVDALWNHLGELSWGWVVAGIAMQLTAVSFATLRWRALLAGQGIRPSWSFLGGSILIARFFGAFTPGGFTGFGGWRIYDVARHTGKVARATATIGVETLMGQVAFGVVVMAASIFGFSFIGRDGVIVVNLFFLGVIGVALGLLAKPELFRVFAKVLPPKVQNRVQTLVIAICAYEGKGRVLGQAFVYGVAVHAFNNLIYVCAAQALGVQLSVGQVFFASALQIFATLVPASINGMGLRETAAVALYTSAEIGLDPAVAVLIPLVGFILCEMSVSAVGGLIFLARRNYKPVIEVDEKVEETEAQEAIDYATNEEELPSVLRGLSLGFAAGIAAGFLVGVTEGLVVMLSAHGGVSAGVMGYGAMAYGLFCGVGGAVFGASLAFLGRLIRKKKMDEGDAYGRIAAVIVAAFALALGFFRVRRDIFREELVLKSAKGLGVLLACAVAAGLVYLLLSLAFRLRAKHKFGKYFQHPIGAVAFHGGIAAVILFGAGARQTETTPLPRPDAPEGAGNVLFVVVDTLRADHLPAYGYEQGSTPNLDAFADDAIRFRMPFANASWTRPSFASILTGRLPSNHGVMAKSDALPEELTTLPEAMRDHGYSTRGLVTNYNIAPYYNFQQGFDQYQYLEPNFVLGADDSAAKLLLVQVLKRVVEKIDVARGVVEAGHAYQDAEVVNAEITSWLDEEDGQRPFFYFVGYMDPHDPYYIHPYNGTGYSRAANQRPDPSEADRLRELYNGEITYWDSQFGALIEDLKRRGLYDDMTIVVTADHGEEFCEHGGFWHGTTLYDEQIRVPLFVKLPENRRGGTSVGHWVQSIDLMPSVLRLAGAEVPEGIQGGDIFRGSDVVYAEESHEGNVLEAVRERRGTDEWKMITANANNPRGLEPVEVYRVDNDPSETQNLAENEEETVAALQETMEGERARALEGAVQGVTVELTAEDIEKNCRLGYWSREACCEQGIIAYCD